ncbi:hypothetical protein [Lysinibacillus xylanilyticus]
MDLVIIGATFMYKSKEPLLFQLQKARIMCKAYLALHHLI